jgi:hypothetical protein
MKFLVLKCSYPEHHEPGADFSVVEASPEVGRFLLRESRRGLALAKEVPDLASVRINDCSPKFIGYPDAVDLMGEEAADDAMNGGLRVVDMDEAKVEKVEGDRVDCCALVVAADGDLWWEANCHYTGCAIETDMLDKSDIGAICSELGLA